MPKRPLSITIISWLFIAAGIGGIVYHSTEINIHHPFEYDLILALIVRLLAIAGGVFMLRGANWSRWLLALWLVYHVALSAVHSFPQTAMHAVLLAVVTFFFFRPKANEYFNKAV